LRVKTQLVYLGFLFVSQSDFDKQIKKPTYASCVLTVNFDPNYKMCYV